MKRKAITQKTRKGEGKRAKGSQFNQPIVIGPSSAKFAPEMKAVDVNFNANIPPGTAAAFHVSLLNGLTLGADRQNRIGRRVQVKKIHCLISLNPVTPVPTSVPETIVFALVVDLDATGLPAQADIFQDVAFNGTQTTNVFSGFNLNSAKRFKILKKKVVPLRICGTATGALPCNGAAFQAEQDTLVWEWHVKTDILTQFNAGNTGSITDIENGAIYLVWWTDLGVGLPESTFDFHGRVRFYD